MRFRGTLAARVALLAALAVALSVAGVAGAAYLTVQHQLVASLDHSLLDRAERVAHNPQIEQLAPERRDMVFLGAADMRYAFLYQDGSHNPDEAFGDARP